MKGKIGRLAVVLVVLVSLVGTSSASAGGSISWAKRCVTSPAFKEHIREVVIGGEVDSDWLTHLSSPCNSVAYHVGKVLEQVLIEEIGPAEPYTP